ncbi:hypothetical protein C5B85_18205 [Pseudoclavibacter sp. AY1F1]|nr:hypothetical protein C5B85_18205 [Pseudoclavibacter sp. AY1F1]
MDYDSLCTVCIIYVEDDTEDRLVYERPQMQIPKGRLSAFDRIRISQFPDDDALTDEAKRIFIDMKRQRRIGASAAVRAVFIARTAGAALEMNL